MIVLFSIAISILLIWVYTLHSSKRASKLPPLEYHGLPVLGHLPYLIGGDSAHLMFVSDTLLYSSVERGQNLSRLELGFKTVYREFFRKNEFYKGHSPNLIQKNPSLTQKTCVRYMSFASSFLCDPEDIATVSNACLSKPWMPYSLMKDLLGHSIFTEPEPAIWRPRRKVFNRGFTQHMLDQYLITFNEHSRFLISVLEQYVGKGPFDQHEHVELLTVDNLLKTALNLTNQDTKMKQQYVNGTTRLLQIWTNRIVSPLFYTDFVFKWTAMFKEQTEVIRGLHKTLNEIIERKKHELRNTKLTDEESGRRFKPIIDWLLEMEETGEFTRKDVIDQMHTMMTAGLHTSSTSICLILCALGTYPRVQDKLYAELQEVFGDSDRNVERQDLNKLVYLDAITKEVLRLYSAAPMGLRCGKTDVKLKNYTIPKGCYYLMAFGAANRHFSWGVDREVFRPERWLEPDGVPISANAFTTFGIGKRGCIGRTFSMYFLKATVAQIVRQYRIKADIRKLQLRMDITIQLSAGHEISIENRGEAKTQLQEVFGDSDRNVERQDLNKLVYLDAITKEVLRLYSAAPMGLRCGKTDVKLKNYTIPKGCYYLMAFGAANRHFSWGVDREFFRPERWLEPDGVPISANAFTTFGIGKRGCIGRTFSMYFLKATVAQIVRQYRIKADIRKLQLRMDITIQLSAGHEISIENRGEAKTQLQEVFGDSDRNVERQDLNKLVYLDAITKEVLRLYSAAPMGLRCGKTDVKLKNYTIPKGCYYLMAFGAANRHFSWGVDREFFRPERWLEPDGVPISANAFTTFGIGKRGCIGRTFSMYFLKATVAQIVRQYRIKADIRKLQLRMDITIQLSAGHEISIENRGEAKTQ